MKSYKNTKDDFDYTDEINLINEQIRQKKLLQKQINGDIKDLKHRKHEVKRNAKFNRKNAIATANIMQLEKETKRATNRRHIAVYGQ